MRGDNLMVGGMLNGGCGEGDMTIVVVAGVSRCCCAVLNENISSASG